VEIVAADIGGTHARFTIATYTAQARLQLGKVVTLKTADYAGLPAAWKAFAAAVGRPLPNAAALALACPIRGDTLPLTNSPWVIRRSTIKTDLGLETVHLMNDFGAVTAALPWLAASDRAHLCGPDLPLPVEGVISVLGPGTGLGVGALVRRDGRDIIIETEGSHADFAAVDAIDVILLKRLQERYLRVSVERVVSGPGLAHIYETLGQIQQQMVQIVDDETLWTQAIAGATPLARAALERFCMNLGTAAGDIALVQGASAVVIAGGIAPRIIDLLRTLGFVRRFHAKGRFEAMMEQMPVSVCVHPQPGLLGAAASLIAREGIAP